MGTPWLEASRPGVWWLTGDVFEQVARIPDNSIDLVMTSPPFLNLRSYLPSDHGSKHLEIGSEATPADFIDTLLDVVEACARVLTPHGSLVYELGDTYSGSGGAGGDYDEDGLREGQPKFKSLRRKDDRDAGWPMGKSLTLIPQSFAWALAYGRNPFNGRETGRWRIRNMVAWARPNPPVGALADKFRPATSYLTVATKARDRWFDGDAVRTPYSERFIRGIENGEHRGAQPGAVVGAPAGERVQMAQLPKEMSTDHAGAPLLDYWEIPTQPYKGSHYATFPEEIPRRVILSMCPQSVCRVCEEPRRRITEVEYEPHGQKVEENKAVRGGAGASGEHAQAMEYGRATRVVTGSTWTDCGHDDWRPGVVLDPFAGSGTSGFMAFGNGRSAVLIDLDERNLDLARDRIGPLFFEEWV